MAICCLGLSEKGPYVRGSTGPKIERVLQSNAVAMWRGPLSVPITNLDAFNIAMSSDSEVFPEKFSVG